MIGQLLVELFGTRLSLGTSELDYLNSIVAREVTNGMWFIASLFLLASMAKFLWPILRKDFRVWNYGPDVKLAWALTMIALGSAMRAGWIWALLIASDLKLHAFTQVLQDLVIISYAAIACGIWGCVCSVKAITQAVTLRSKWSYWTFMVTVIVVVPLAVNLGLAMHD